MEVQRSLYQPGMNPVPYTGVPAHAYAITNAEAPRTRLFTCNVISSLAVIIYDKTNKIGALLHIDCDVCNTIETVFSRFEELGSQMDQLKVHMIGSCAAGSWGTMAVDTYKTLRKQILKTTKKIVDSVPSQRVYALTPIDHEEKIKLFQYTQIGLDVSTGKVFTSKDPSNLIEESDKAYSKKARAFRIETISAYKNKPVLGKILNSPLAEVYDGTKV